MTSQFSFGFQPTASEPTPDIRQVFSHAPASLRGQCVWFVTGHASVPIGLFDIPFRTRYSPITTAELRPLASEDYGTYDQAIQAVEEQPALFDSIGIRISPPWLALILEASFDFNNKKLRASARDVMKSLGGYWERGQRWFDLQAILRCDASPRLGTGRIRDHKVLVTDNALLNLTGQWMRGHAGDPETTNQHALHQVIKYVGR
jgi:hypothetical protein